MKSKNLEHLQYFVGRPCSIFTVPINRQLDEAVAWEHFAVRVQEIDIDGLWGTHLEHGTVSFFPMAHIVSIQEELELNPKNPEHARIIEKLEQQKPPAPKKPVAPPDDSSPFVDIGNLETLARQTKRGLDMLELSQAIKR